MKGGIVDPDEMEIVPFQICQVFFVLQRSERHRGRGGEQEESRRRRRAGGGGEQEEVMEKQTVESGGE